MLGQKIEFKIKYDEKEITLNFTIRALKNIFSLVGYSPFEYLSDFLNANSEEKQIYIAQILYCITDGELNIFDVMQNLLNDLKVIESIEFGLTSLINLELRCEIEEDKYENIDDTKELTREEKVNNFISWYNNMYYVALYQLHLTEDKFLNTTVRELKTLDKLNKDYYKNILLNTYITLTRSSTEEKEEELKAVTNSENNIRIKDILMRM